MAQPVRKGIDRPKPTARKRKERHSASKRPRRHPKYGTSKLEEKFAEEFLDRLGAEYVYQFEAQAIGRFFDFYLPKENVLIEVDGDYWHSYGVLYEDMTPTQKRNRRADEQKDRWALLNGIKLIRIWEHDINSNPSAVMEMLECELSCAREKAEKKKEMKRRH